MVWITRMSTVNPIPPPAPRHGRASLLTHYGTAALAVVRIEGPGAAKWVEAHLGFIPGKQARHGRWRSVPGDPQSFLDDPVVIEVEGAYEIHLHGGVRIVERLLAQAAAAGFEVLRGDEAVAATAVDEVESALPYVATQTGLKMLLAQPAAWRALNPRAADIQKLLADRTLGRMIRPATVALVGAANVGKSTLANFLFREERSLVADRPGTTRDWVGHLAEIGGLPVTLIDTPGRRQSEDEIEQQAISISAGPVERADLVVVMIDATHPEDVPAGLHAAFKVANKCDLAEPPADCLPISAASGAGVPELIEAIQRQLGVDLRRPDRPLVWTPRQRAVLASRGRHGLGVLRREIGRT